MLLADAGRRVEAMTLARRYLQSDPSSPWADRLRTEVFER